MCHWWSRVFECQCLCTVAWSKCLKSELYGRGHGQGWREADTESWSWEQRREGGFSCPSSVPCLFVLTIFANSIGEHRSRYWEWFKGASCLLLARGPQAFWACLCSHFMLVMLFSVISLACPRFLRFIQLLLSQFSCIAGDVSLASSLRV